MVKAQTAPFLHRQTAAYLLYFFSTESQIVTIFCSISSCVPSSAQVREGRRRLADWGGDADRLGQGGVWAGARDRDTWERLVGGARTVAAAALGLYLLGDRGTHFVGGLVQEAQVAAERWDDQCYISGAGGTLVCCELCPRTVAPASMGWRAAPKHDFFCPYCLRDRERRARRAGGAGGKGGGAEGGTGGDKRGKKAGARAGARPEKVGARAWSEKVEKLRRDVGRHGLHNGSVCELEPDERGRRAGERCFVKVLDGETRAGADGREVKLCRFFSEWIPERPRRMKLGSVTAPVPVARIMSAGTLEEMLDGSAADGYRPADLLS
jgi:hypothetical protein